MRRRDYTEAVRALDVVRTVLGECWLLIGLGVAIGVGTALAAGRFVAQVLWRAASVR